MWGWQSCWDRGLRLELGQDVSEHQWFLGFWRPANPGFGAFCSAPVAAFNGGTFHTFSRPSLYGREAAPHMECLPGSSALLRDEPR